MSAKQWPLVRAYHHNTERWAHNLRSLGGERSPVAMFTERLDRPRISLPHAIALTVGLGEAIHARHSCRRFTVASLSLPQVSTLLAFGYGVHRRTILGDGQELLERPVPSGGGLYPLELYVLAQRVEALAPGIYHYLPLYHAVERIDAVELPDRLLGELFLGQHYLGAAAMVICIAAMLPRSLWKYTDRGYRYILMEAGHVAQNLNLAAVALELGSLNLGGFLDRPLAALLCCHDDEVPLYGVAVGQPGTADRARARVPDGGGGTPAG